MLSTDESIPKLTSCSVSTQGHGRCSRLCSSLAMSRVIHHSFCVVVLVFWSAISDLMRIRVFHVSADMYITISISHMFEMINMATITVVASDEGISIVSSKLAIDIFFRLLQCDVHVAID